MKAESETSADYKVGTEGETRPGLKAERQREDETISMALTYLRQRLRVPGTKVGSSVDVASFLKLKTAHLEHEVFGLLYLDAQHSVMHDEELFRGTLTQTSVYPREVVKAALRHNAANVILYHNHPSGLAAPSSADEFITQAVKNALALVDVRVLDHIIVGGMNTVSFAEKGLL